MSDDIRLEKDDVTVQEAIEECGECTHTLDGAGFVVMVDFRSIGTTVPFAGNARYCLQCAEHIAARIRDGLPAAGAQPRD